MMTDAGGIGAFADYIKSLGFEPPARIEPGQWAPFSTNGKHGDGAGRAKLFPDCEGGIVHDWRSGESWNWQAKRENPRTEAEQRAWREKCERSRCEAQAERERQTKQTAERAGALWKAGTPADESHAYLKAKGIKAHGLKVYRGPITLNEMRCDGALMIPARNAGGEVQSLSFISPQGEKRFLNGPKPSGCYYSIGKPDGALCIAEGFATAASIHEATGLAVAVAFDCGNLEATAKAIRSKIPGARIILAADNDVKDSGENPGIQAATKAAQAVGGHLAIPEMNGAKCDFNDLAQTKGAEAVRNAIERAGTPNVPTHQPAPEKRADPVVVGEWPEPQPLPDGLRPVEPFDYALLPDTLRPWIEDIAERMQCPPDFVAVAAMVGLGSVIGRQVGIRPQGKTDWEEVANLWGCIVARPGAMKSPAMEAALSPLKRLEADALKRFTTERDEWEARVRLAKLKREEGEKAARKKLATSIHADVREDLSTEEPEEPLAKRYIANDTSYESLGELLRGNQNGILVFRDELVSLLKGLDREDSAGARGFYLSGASGKQGYSFDRITRKGASLDAVCLSVLGSTQPGRIAEYIRGAVRGGSGDDGLMQRFGLIVWPDASGEWRDVDTYPNTDARRAAVEVFQRLDAIDPAAIGAEQDRDYHGEPEGVPYLRLDPEALGAFLEWRTALEARLRGEREEPALESHFAKYRKVIPSLALILHLADNGQGPVTASAMLKALAWGEYLESHARRVYASLTSPENAAARAVVARIKKGDIPATFRAQWLYRHGWANLSDRETVRDALELLADLDWLSKGVNDSTGGRFATEYRVNPRGLA